MPSRNVLLPVIGFAAVLFLLAASDALVNRNRIVLPFPFGVQAAGNTDATAAKDNGKPVEEILREQKFELVPPAEKSLLERVVPSPDVPRTQAILLDGDRVALFSWVESAQVKTYFNALKEALHISFSPQVKDLRDETLSAPDKPTVNFLTFQDPALSDERFVFVRVRERLFEIHVANGKDAQVSSLLTELTR